MSQNMVLRLECAKQEVMLKHRLFGHRPEVSGSVDLGWGLKICISSKFLGDATAAVIYEPHFVDLWFRVMYAVALFSYLIIR